MYCIIIQQASGRLVREVREELPDTRELDYLEEFHTEKDSWASGAVVINVYKIGDE